MMERKARMIEKHTPGPWGQIDNEIQNATSGMVICTVTTSDDFPCITDDEDQSEVEARAKVDLECAENARLIAAAPDLLAVLNAVRIEMKNRDRTEREQWL